MMTSEPNHGVFSGETGERLGDVKPSHKPLSLHEQAAKNLRDAQALMAGANTLQNVTAYMQAISEAFRIGILGREDTATHLENAAKWLRTAF